ncbi:S1/P1 Nuclease [Erythrobacter arachoides]|uniref:S1/P1 Nuclease n=1 Tax=Aurantiacibacter arachoides TaxID=1850444 RepID=A0A844ZZI0_9SPHN|nr:S1/P1 nuclease [Aurantiacibacter arachoides]MXO92864.1 S1/P1 Nuclease [Aurantiacibacter arachoides]GGD53870.1 endonuclease [Aurantiacibacter arachoides]
MLKPILSVATLAIAFTAMPAQAWGPHGHRITATIAQDNVSGRTRAEIAEILGAETLAEASTFPDEERSNPDPFWQETASPFHYVTLPDGTRVIDMAHPPEGDALTALERFTAVLRDANAPAEERQLALRFVVHIVSDLHMPLHAGRPGDRGGNDVRVDWFGQQTNLHWVWDEGMIQRQQLSFSEYAERLEGRMTPGKVIAWWDADPATWIGESVALRERIYPATGPEAGLGTLEAPVRLGYDYNWQWSPDVEHRLMQSGIRLAAYLDKVFAES